MLESGEHHGLFRNAVIEGDNFGLRSRLRYGSLLLAHGGDGHVGAGPNDTYEDPGCVFCVGSITDEISITVGDDFNHIRSIANPSIEVQLNGGVNVRYEPAKLRLRFEGSMMRSRQTPAVSERTIRGNVKTYIQHCH